MSDPYPESCPGATVHHRLESAGIETVNSRTVICLTCGRNLKCLPVAGVCPECGEGYSARGLHGKNIHRPGTAHITVSQLVLLVVLVPTAVVATAFLLSVNPRSHAIFAWVFMVPVVLVIDAAALWYFARCTSEVWGWFRAWRLERPYREEIRAEEEQAARGRPRVGGPRGRGATRESAKISAATYDRLRQMGYAFEVDWPVFCATCGYSLRGLNVVGVCPECGKEYNARPMKMVNVRHPYGTALPWGNIWSAVIGGIITMLLVQSLATQFYVMTAVLAGVFGVATVAFVRLALRGINDHRHAQRALRQMEEEK